MKRCYFVTTVRLLCLIILTVALSVSLVFVSEANRLSFKSFNQPNVDTVKLNRTYEEIGVVFKSKCSRKADSRGAHQKVVSYSLYGELSDPAINEKYVKPLIENARNLPSLLPGWILRVYHNYSGHDVASWEILQESLGSVSNFWDHVDLCYVRDIRNVTRTSGRYVYDGTWRFLPLFDSYVDTLLCRDADSLITTREMAAVDEWLASDKIFHVMRDHPSQCEPVLSGLWGAKLNHKRNTIRRNALKMFTIRHEDYDGFDAVALQQCMWPVMSLNSMIHDSYCCNVFNESRSRTRPFPDRRLGNEFVGKIAYWRPSSLKWPSFECPVQCRPQDHLDWEYC